MRKRTVGEKPTSQSAHGQDGGAGRGRGVEAVTGQVGCPSGSHLPTDACSSPPPSSPLALTHELGP